MSLQTGDDGLVAVGAATIADITGWTFTTAARTRDYASSATGGYRKRVVGAREGRGSFRFLLDPADAITQTLEEGSQVTLQLYVNPDDFYTVPAVIDSLELDVDVATGKVTGGRAEFSSNGAWMKPSY